MKFWSLFKSGTFCWIFSLQSGTVVSIMILTALGITSLVNIGYFLITSRTISTNAVPFCMAMVYLVAIGIGLAITFHGAYTENKTWMIRGAFVTLVAILFYLIIGTMSFFTSRFSITCISLRCPEHIWLQVSYWRVHRTNGSIYDYEEEDESENETSLLRDTMRTTTFILPISPRMISRRRHRPNRITKVFGVERGNYLGEEEHKDEVEEPIDQVIRKPSDEDGDNVNSCPEVRGERIVDNSRKIMSSFVLSIFYFIVFVGFQLYCVYGFLCFANELRIEVV